MRRILFSSLVIALTAVTGLPLASAAAPPATAARPVASTQALLAPGDWGQYRNGSPSGGFNQAETALSPATAKRLQLRRTMAATTFFGGQAGATGHGLLYTSGLDGGIAAYDETTGASRWSAPRGSNKIAVGDSAVYTVNDYDGPSVADDGLYAYRADTGAPLWHRAVRSDSGSISPPTLAGPRVLLGVERCCRPDDSVSEVLSIRAATGGVQWRTRLPQNGQVSHVAVSDGVAVVTVGVANVYALDLVTGALRWSFLTTLGTGGGGVSVPSPVIRAQRVYVGLVDGVFRALDLSTGRLVWSRNLGGAIFETAAEGNGVVYAATEGGDPAAKDLFAMDSQNGNVLWSRATGTDISSPTLANGVLYLGIYFGGTALKAYDAATGVELGSWATTTNVLTEPMVSHGTVYIGVGDFGVPHYLLAFTS